ncbi:MAG: methylmalonyl-CoA epimerase [Bacteroidota bacterium]
MNKIEHIGIAVNNMEAACDLYERLLGVSCYKMEAVKSEGVNTAFFQVGDDKIELLSAIDGVGTIAKFLERKGEGIHHIAFNVEDIAAEMLRLKDEGFLLLNEIPKRGADNKLVCFVHPKETHGVLIELCQEIK